jgi:predicted TIM-barrel fold metal-dependent hydrolase
MAELNPSGEYSLVQAENNFVAAQVAAAPHRLAGLCGLDPLADYALEEVQRCAQVLGLNGVSLHFSDSNINLRSGEHLVKLAEFFEFLEALDYPALIHLATRNPYYGSVDVKLFIDNVLVDSPSVDIQIAHFGGYREFTLQTDRAMSEFVKAFSDGRLQPSRLQFDLANTPPFPATQAAAQNQTRQRSLSAMYAQRIRQLDPQQVLFASSWSEKLDRNSRLVITQIKTELALRPQTIASFFSSSSRFLEK